MNLLNKRKFNQAQELSEVARGMILITLRNDLPKTDRKKMARHCLYLLGMAKQLIDEIKDYEDYVLN